MRIAVSVAEKEIKRGKDSPYFKALLQAGAKPEEIFLVNGQERERLRIQDYDGVIFAGGEDVDPSRYHETARYNTVLANPRRDDFEFHLLEQAQQAALPVLGICRGAQMINVAFGGTLYQDLERDGAELLPHRQAGSRGDATHTITIQRQGSRLGAVLPEVCKVNSLHHQAIRRVGAGLKVTAYSEIDRIVEAVEAENSNAFLAAVQWHPEELTARPEQLRLLEHFVEQCRKAEAQKPAPVPQGAP